jgi:hypothetical protein
MKQGLTHIVFVVDRSGSMKSIATDMIGGYNSFIEKQKEVPSECYVSFYQFDDSYDVVFERVKLSEVKELDHKTFVPRGGTALYDALGRTINEYGKYLSDLPEDERPDRVLVVTITDGDNNASRQFSVTQIRDMVQHQTEAYKWSFVFLGSNIDAWAAGADLGVSQSSTLQFASVKGSVSKAFSALNSNTRMYRSAEAPIAYSFSAQDVADQDEFLDSKLKSKNQAQTKSSKTTTK